MYVDATKTIHAPYCQGNRIREYAGQQWVAMSLCALIYSTIRRITSTDDMIQIMIVVYQLYSSQCHCLQQTLC